MFKCPVCRVTKNMRGEPFASAWAVASHIAVNIFESRHKRWAQTKVPGINIRLKGSKLGNELIGAVEREIEADIALRKTDPPTQVSPSNELMGAVQREIEAHSALPKPDPPTQVPPTGRLKRRLRDSRDPVRYMLVSESTRRFILYYNVSSDTFIMNEPSGGTLFKRREVAESVKKLLGKGISIVKYTTKHGKLKRLSPYRGRWIRGRKMAVPRRTP